MSFLKKYPFELLILLLVVAGVAGILWVTRPAQQETAPTAQVNQVLTEEKATVPEVKRNLENITIPDLMVADPQVILKLDGSNTIGAKLAPTLAGAYLKSMGAVGVIKKPLQRENESHVIGFLPENNRVIAIAINAHGSSTGFKALINKTTDIAMSSRVIKEKENLSLLLDAGDMTKPESEHIIALDGLAVINHPSNPIKSLTVEQLANIFSGKINNWQALGGPNQAIKLYARDDNSGTFDTFKSLVLKKHKVNLAAAARYESNEKLAQAIRQDSAGIGFTGYAYADDDILMEVAASRGLPAIRPNQFTIGSEDYALSRRLFLYANQKRHENPYANGFIEFAKSKLAQDYVEQAHFIPQKIITQSMVAADDFPQKYRQVIEQGKRLSMTFRLRADRAEIDNKSAQDIDFLVHFLEARPMQKVALVGFSAGESNNETADTNRAMIRSKLLAHELRQRGIKNVDVISLGSQLPIDSNSSEIGRYKNNRTEIWLMENENSI